MSLENPLITDTVDVKGTVIETTGGVGNLNSIMEDGFDVIPDEIADESPLLVQPKHGEPASNKVSNRRLFDGPIVERELPEFNGKFEIQADKVSVLSDVIRIQNNIQQAGVISTEDIAQVDAIVPGFVNDENPIAQYTAAPSKTNLEEGLNDIDTMLEHQYDGLRLSQIELAQSYLRLNNGMTELIRRKFQERIIELNKGYAQLLFFSQRDDLAQVNFILNNGMKLRYFLDMPLYDDRPYSASPAGASSKDPLEGTFVQALANKLRALHDKGDATYAVSSCLRTNGQFLRTNGCLFERQEDDTYRHIVNSKNAQEAGIFEYRLDVTYGDLFQFVIGPRCVEILRCILKTIERNIEGIKYTVETVELVQESKEHIATRVKQLIDTSSWINQHVQENTRLVRVLDDLFGLMDIYKEFICQLAEKQKPIEKSETTVTASASIAK